MATAPVLNSVTLAHPSAYNEDREYWGGTSEMADGTLVFDLVNANAKRGTITLEWQVITDAEVTTIQGAVDGIAGSSSVAFTSPRNQTFNVSLPKNLAGPRVESVMTANGLRNNVTLQLRQA